MEDAQTSDAKGAWTGWQYLISDGKSSNQRRSIIDSNKLVVACLSFMAVVLTVFYYHDRFWWPPDDGAYAYVAQRILRGAVLNGDVQDIHAGYVHFIHALAFRLFGEDILSLRYPLAVLTVLQAAIVFALLYPKGPLAAFSAAFAAASLTFVQFLNPTANWYALAITFAVIAVATWSSPEGRWRYAFIGFLIVTTVLLRQLSGLFLAMGALTWLLVERREPDAGRSGLAKAILLVIGAVLVVYFSKKGSVTSFVMFGFWPLAVLTVAWKHLSIGNSTVSKIVLGLAFGGSLALFPLIVYHLNFGTLYLWLDDVFVAALHLNGLPFFSQANFAHFFLLTLFLVPQNADVSSILSGLFWIVLLSSPIMLGTLFLYRILRSGNVSGWAPLPVIAIFYAPVSAHYQIPIYLMYSVCLTLVAFLSITASQTETNRAAGIMIALAVIGLTLHAGQPLSRSLEGTILGTTVALDAPEGIAGARIAMERSDQATYSTIVRTIRRYSAPHEKILALPFIPEFYFLSDRQSAFRFISVPFGVRSELKLAEILNELSNHPVRVVINRREDKYHSPMSMKIVEHIRSTHVLFDSIGDFDIYVEQKRAADGG